MSELKKLLEQINRDAWQDDPTRLRVIARASDEALKLLSVTEVAATERNAILEEAEDAMLGVFGGMNAAYLFTSGFDSRIIEARDAIRALRSDAANGEGNP